MNRIRFALMAAGVLLSTTSAVLAGEAVALERATVVPRGVGAVCPTTPPSYSVEVPVLARVQGSAFFRTAIAITNNTNQTITASYQFSYTCVSAGCSPAGGFYRTSVKTLSIPAIGSFEQDDFIDYMNSPPQSLLQPGANAGSIGTLLVTFNNLPTCNGYEANVVARTYNRIVEADPNQGTVGFAYNSSLFFDSADTTLIGYARDSKAAPTIAGKLRSNIGVRNTDINGVNQKITVDITFYDTATAAKVGNTITFVDLQPGEVRQVSDIWASAAISSNVKSVIVFADVRNPTATSPTMEGYITIIDGQNTNDAAFFSMICADANGCGN